MAGFRRVIALFWGLVLLAGAAGIAACLVNHRLAQVAVDFFDRCLLYNMQLCFLESRNLWWPILIGILLLLLGLLFVIAAFKRRRPPKQVRVSSVDGGDVEISFAAVDNVVRKAAASVSGVRNVNSKLQMAKDGLHVALDITLPPELSVPEVGAEVRRQVARQLDTMIGIQPKEIAVSVSNVTPEKPGRGNALATPIVAVPTTLSTMAEKPEKAAAEEPVIEEVIAEEPVIEDAVIDEGPAEVEEIVIAAEAAEADLPPLEEKAEEVEESGAE